MRSTKRRARECGPRMWPASMQSSSADSKLLYLEIQDQLGSPDRPIATGEESMRNRLPKTLEHRESIDRHTKHRRHTHTKKNHYTTNGIGRAQRRHILCVLNSRQKIEMERRQTRLQPNIWKRGTREENNIQERGRRMGRTDCSHEQLLEERA